MALTDTQIKALKPSDKRYSVTDDRGLSLEVFPTGGLAWRYRYRLNGKLEKVAIGKYPALGLKAARTRRDELATTVAHGESPAKQKQLRKLGLATATTVQEFGERYFVDVVMRDRKDTTIMRRYLQKEIYPSFGNKPMRDVTVEEVQRIVFEKRDHGFPAAAAGIRNLCKRMWEYALVCGVADTNPALAIPVRFITKARPRSRALSPSGPLQPFAQNALNKALNGVNVPIDPFTIHDLRRTGSTRLHEAGFPSDVIEKSLNHTIGGVRGIYNRAEYATQRREMLQIWAEYVDDLVNERRVILANFGQRTSIADRG